MYVKVLKTKKQLLLLSLNMDLLEDLDNGMNNTNLADTSDTSSKLLSSVENQISSIESPDLKQGIKLPTSSREWEITNDFFKFKFSNQPIADGNLDSMMEHMNDVIYSYFKQNYGTVNSANHSNLMSSYKNISIRELKKEL